MFYDKYTELRQETRLHDSTLVPWHDDKNNQPMVLFHFLRDAYTCFIFRISLNDEDIKVAENITLYIASCVTCPRRQDTPSFCMKSLDVNYLKVKPSGGCHPHPHQKHQHHHEPEQVRRQPMPLSLSLAYSQLCQYPRKRDRTINQEQTTTVLQGTT